MWVFGSSVGSTPARGRRRVRSRALRGGITLAFGRIFSNRLPRARVEKARGRTCSPRPSVVSEHKRSSSSRPLSSLYQRHFRSACAARHARWSPYSRRCWMTSGMSLRSRIRASGCLNQKQPGNSRIRDSARATSSFSDSPMLSGEDVARLPCEQYKRIGLYWQNDLSVALFLPKTQMRRITVSRRKRASSRFG